MYPTRLLVFVVCVCFAQTTNQICKFVICKYINLPWNCVLPIPIIKVMVVYELGSLSYFSWNPTSYISWRRVRCQVLWLVCFMEYREYYFKRPSLWIRTKWSHM